MILHKKFKYDVPVSKEVIWWNYWDHEHLDVVHSGYKSAEIIYENEKVYLGYFTVKAPFVPFLSFSFPIFGVYENENTYVVHSFQYGIPSKFTFTTKEKENGQTELEMDYKFHLKGLNIFYYPILNFFIKKWNHRVWKEDLPLKNRRQMVLDLGFKDFHGLPDEIKDRVRKEKIKFKLPIPRPKKSPRDKYILNNKI